MQELPRGSMLAVHLSEGELQPWLRDDVSLAAINAPRLSVVSGPVDAMERMAEAFRAQHVDIQPLRTSHAFHSAMMEPILAAFVQRVSGVPRCPPMMPFISTLTGTWIAADQAVDPGYWGRQARYGVRFGPGVAELLMTPGRVLLEVGPGTTLSTLAKLQLRGEAPCTVVNSLRHAQGGRPDHECMLSALGSLWMAGVSVDWKRLYTREHRQRVPLPTYPFERERFWIDAPQAVSTRPVGARTYEESAASRVSDMAGKVEHVEETSSKESAPTAPAEPPLYSRPDLPSEYVAPQTDLEEMLANVWRGVLGFEKIGIHDNFLDLGGDSLLATQLLSRLRAIFRMDLPPNSLFEAPTIAELALYMIAREARPGLVEKTATIMRQIEGMTEEEVSQNLREGKVGAKRR
jgi:acyl transferase domain-containing protein